MKRLVKVREVQCCLELSKWKESKADLRSVGGSCTGPDAGKLPELEDLDIRSTLPSPSGCHTGFE